MEQALRVARFDAGGCTVRLNPIRTDCSVQTPGLLWPVPMTWRFVVLNSSQENRSNL